MDRRPIGVFDSGLGGLTAVAELKRLLPHEDIVYFGDTARVPYGTRSRDTIERFVRQDIEFLMSKDVKIILAACCTASTILTPEMRESYPVPVIGTIEASARAAVRNTQNGRVTILGTNATVKSGAFERAIQAENADIATLGVPCPLFVPLIENGYAHKMPIAELIVKDHLEKALSFGADTVILGCTHYPLISGLITEVLGDVTAISSGAECAKELAAHIREHDMENSPDRKGACRAYVSDSCEQFKRHAGMFLQEGGVMQITQVSPEAETEGESI